MKHTKLLEIVNKFPKHDPDIVLAIVKQAYLEGYREALYNYAWYKDGVMYVGCGD